MGKKRSAFHERVQIADVLKDETKAVAQYVAHGKPVLVAVEGLHGIAVAVFQPGALLGAMPAEPLDAFGVSVLEAGVFDLAPRHAALLGNAAYQLGGGEVSLSHASEGVGTVAAGLVEQGLLDEKGVGGLAKEGGKGGLHEVRSAVGRWDVLIP